jgi:hypothetical protein
LGVADAPSKSIFRGKKMKAFSFVLLALATFAILAAGISGQEKPCQGSVLAIVEQIAKVDDGVQSVRVRNGEIAIETTAIKEIVSRGPRTLPVLLAAMKTEELSFDGVARSYSACLQILRTIDPNTDAYWSGGCATKVSPAGILRVFPSGRLDERKFRSQVVADLEKKYETLVKKR